MIAATIGKSFLKVYNERNNVNITAKEFFEKEYVHLFFNHSKYMMTGGNSPLENPKIQWKKGLYPEPSERVQRISKTIKKIENGDQDASIAIGFPASEDTAPTSGQVTDLKFPLGIEDTFLSWIGSGFGIGVSGGLSIFFDHPEILLKLFEGWKVYRDYLNDPSYSKMRGNQINTWNGQWLVHVYSKNYRPNDPVLNFKGLETTKDGTIEVNTISWVKVLIGLAQNFSISNLTGYIYSLGQTNITVGFIPFQLNRIKYPLELYKKLFGENEYLTNSERIENLYGTAHSFQKACQQGAIGISALEPKDLRGFVPSSNKEAKMPDYKKAKEETVITFKTYLTWLLAMLNNEELWQIAGKAAESFLQYESGAAKARTDRSNDVQAVLNSAYRRPFIEALTKLLEKEKTSNANNFTELAELVNKMPAENVQYFTTLIRFRYAEKSKNKTEKIES